MKQRLVESNTDRVRRIESGEQTLVGVNSYQEGEDSPLTAGGSSESILAVDESAERDQIERLRAFRSQRNDSEVTSALKNLHDIASSGGNTMPPSIRAAKASSSWATPESER
jgi:(2R)-ethylmalonyl-CoA mutase